MCLEAADIKTKGGIIRNAEDRSKFMHGYDCRCCASYYNALNLSPGERQNRVNQVSRHRAFEPIPATPERYWDVRFPNEEDQKTMGVKISDSPLFKNSRLPRSKIDDKENIGYQRKKTKRKIFEDNLKSETQ